MIQWDEPEWKKAEEGLFFFDIGGTMIVMAALVAILAYIGMQLSYMSDLEGNITADYLAREQLDILCVEQSSGDLGIKLVEENGYCYQIESSRTSGMLAELVHYGVSVTWQDKRGLQRLEIGTDVPAKIRDSEHTNQAEASVA